MNIVDKAYSWLYSKVSKSKFKEYQEDGYLLSFSRCEYQKNRIDFYLSDEGLSESSIISILKLNPYIKDFKLSKSLLKENGILYYNINYYGKSKLVSEFELYEQDWFIRETSDAINDISKEIVSRRRKIGCFIESEYNLSLLRYPIIENITDDDLYFEKAFKKSKNSNRAKVYHHSVLELN